MAYPPRKLSPEDGKAFMRLWADDLAGYPAWVLAEACGQYRRGPENKFFPHPGAIIALCEGIDDRAELLRLQREAALIRAREDFEEMQTMQARKDS